MGRHLGHREDATTHDLSATLQSLRKAKKLKPMVRGGIPSELRARVWPALCGADAKRKSLNDRDYYSRLLTTVSEREAADLATRAASPTRKPGDPPREPCPCLDTIEQIDKDLGRTFPQHRLIATPEGQASLRRLLRAYARAATRVQDTARA